MFNVKLSVLYFLLIVLTVLTVVYVVNDEEDRALQTVESQVRDATNQFRVNKALREAKLREFALQIGKSEVGARLRALGDFRDAFVQVDRHICDPDRGGVKCDLNRPQHSDQRSRLATRVFGDSVFDPFTERVLRYTAALRRKMPEDAKARLKKRLRNQLEDCFGRGSTRCDWRIAYDGLVRAAKRIKVQAGINPDLVLVFDAEGIGVASEGIPTWSSRPDFQAQVRRLRDYVDRSDGASAMPVFHDVVRLQDTGETAYLSVMVPILTPERKFVGAAMAGMAIGGALVAMERQLLGYEVTYLLDGRSLHSTIDDYRAAMFSAKVTQRLKDHAVEADGWIGWSFPYFPYPTLAPAEGEGAQERPMDFGGVFYGPSYRTLRVVLSTRRADWTHSFAKLRLYIPIFGGVLFLIGLILIQLLVRQEIKPFEQIDLGIHEVINGNFDYEFEHGYRDPLPSSMAQSLNLMLAVLLGKPQEESAPGTWDGMGSSVSGGDGGLQMEGAAMDLDEAGRAALAAEPAEGYYRRLYEEYRSARTAADAADEALTYVRFVERLVRNERELCAELGARSVRFVVAREADRVILRPVVLG